MFDVWVYLEDETTRYWVGSLVSLACVLIAYAASKLIRDNPRLRTVMALFACGWVLQMGAYGAPREAHVLANLTADLVSFVQVFAGVLLIEDSASDWSKTIVTIFQAAAFWLLVAILVPHRQEFHDILNQAPIDAYRVELIVALTLGLVSYFALGLGAWSLSRGGMAFFVLAGALLLYSYLSIDRALALMSAPKPGPRLSSGMILAFALAKVVLTGAFSFIVVAFALKPTPVAVPRLQPSGP